MPGISDTYSKLDLTPLEEAQRFLDELKDLLASMPRKHVNRQWVTDELLQLQQAVEDYHIVSRNLAIAITEVDDMLWEAPAGRKQVRIRQPKP